VRRSLPVFLAVVVGLAIWHVGLTWRLLEQDRNLAAQRSRERLEQIADLALAQLTGMLATWELSLREMEALPPTAAVKAKIPPHGALILLGSPSVIGTYPEQPLLFVPDPPAAVPVSDAFETAENLEFRERSYGQALQGLQLLAERPATRAEALLRIGRLERKLNHTEAALAAYERMSGETAASPEGVPYALLAAGARCDFLAGQNGGVKAVERLRAELIEGRWPLRRETFEYYWSEVNRLRHLTEDPPKDSMEFSTLVSQLHQQWQQTRAPGSSGREARPDGSLLIWHSTTSRLMALFAPAGWLAASLKLPANAGDIQWRLAAPGIESSGRPGAGQYAQRSLAEAQLAGKIVFYSISGVPRSGLSRVLWLAAVMLMLVLVLAGAYAMHRGVNRELRVGQLQSDFVSAVSHEFRSPLTTLRSITELLSSGRIAEESRRRQSYTFLERETGRLQRLVEDLLDFGRMESGRKQYRMEPHDVYGLLRAAVTEFREESLPDGFEVELYLDAPTATVKADEEALRRAIRNLLENAVKYSLECRTVWVEGRANRGEVELSVRDRGMGIERREQREIFQKFVRGRAAKRAGIKGTGIGLSMVRQIVEANGGQIRLQSEEGAGSTFTIVLPRAGFALAGVAGMPA